MTLLCRLDGHVDLSERLIECQYELTDGLAYYLCSRRPGELLWLTLCTVIDSITTLNVCNYAYALLSVYHHCQLDVKKVGI